MTLESQYRLFSTQYNSQDWPLHGFQNSSWRVAKQYIAGEKKLPIIPLIK